jgi:hypothetical protein
VLSLFSIKQGIIKPLVGGKCHNYETVTPSLAEHAESDRCRCRIGKVFARSDPE